MSNEPGGPAPVPDPYAVPDPATPPPPPPSGYEAVPPVPSSGYEAVPSSGGNPPPAAPYGAPGAPAQPVPYGAQPTTTPYGQPAATPYGQADAQTSPPAAPPYGSQPSGGQQYGGQQYGGQQYGAPQYGAPQYGSPGYDQPGPYGAQPYGYGQPYVAPPTEGLAIASFVTSMVGLFFFGGLPGAVGLGLGIAALRRIRVSGKAGRGFAIAGIAVGALGILAMLAIAAYIIIIIAVIGTSAGSSDFWDDVSQGTEQGSDDPTDSGVDETLPEFTLRTDLTTGTCLSTYAATYDMSDTEPVDCGVPHEAEVVGLLPMSGPVSLDADDEFDTAYNDAWDACDVLTEGLLPDYFSDGDISLYFPHPDDFAAGSTSAYCVYYGDEPGMTGSATAGTLQLAGVGTES